MAPKKSTPESTITPGVDIEQHVADNYRALVADPDRNMTFKDVAQRAEAEGDKTLAAWARQQAAADGKDVTPDEASPDPDKVKRDADAAAKAAAGETHARGADETGQVDATEAGGTPPTGVPVDYNALTIEDLKGILTLRDVDFSKFSLKGEYVEAAEQSDTAGQAQA
ncbi:hypothetical protein AB1K56_08000 [Microbacterium sp. BWR-S6Y]|uniref:hypothetical protein n=1 Tax=Microbacterium sp. BWR-S6Y TaxID=3232073 RepID=UPI00352826E3